MNCLNSCRIVKMSDCGNIRPRDIQQLNTPQTFLSATSWKPPLFRDRSHQEHVRTVSIQDKIVGSPFSQNRGRKRAEMILDI